MGRRSEQAKKRKRLLGSSMSGSIKYAKHPPTQNTDTASTEIEPLVSAQDLETTISTLETLCEFPDELSRKDVKGVKRAVHALNRVMVDGAPIGTSLSSKISSALQAYRFIDALVLLFEMYIRDLPPKLGSLQRWVRECDATFSVDGLVRDTDAMRCLDLILRIADREMVSGSSQGAGDLVMRRRPVWRARDPVAEELPIWGILQQGRLFDTPPPVPFPNFRPVQHTPGHLRKPPNVYDSTVYASSPGAIRLSTSRPRSPSRVDVPGLPGAFVILDVFTPEECLQIVQAGEAIGFERDEAAGGSAASKSSASVPSGIRAH
ncbi:hypothetical protein BD324DRAFT_624450, partial [Kockovaella imperatae]